MLNPKAKKHVILLHGTGGSGDNFWFPYLKEQLDPERFTVSAPDLPNANRPDINQWLPYMMDNFSFGENTILVGHSAGCPLILSILENIDTRINKAIMVAAFSEPLGGEPEPILQGSYDWNRIKAHSDYFAIINSTDDPWGCDDKAGRKIFDQVGGDLIIRDGHGHMGSRKFDQPYKEFPLVKHLIEN